MAHTAVAHPTQKTSPGGHPLRLVEETSGVGHVEHQGIQVGPVDYAVARYLGVMAGSGLPIPGLHSIAGTVTAHPGTELLGLVGAHVTLKLADGRAFGVTLLDEHGRIGTEARHPVGCLCC